MIVLFALWRLFSSFASWFSSPLLEFFLSERECSSGSLLASPPYVFFLSSFSPPLGLCFTSAWSSQAPRERLDSLLFRLGSFLVYLLEGFSYVVPSFLCFRQLLRPSPQRDSPFNASYSSLLSAVRSRPSLHLLFSTSLRFPLFPLPALHSTDVFSFSVFHAFAFRSSSALSFSPQSPPPSPSSLSYSWKENSFFASRSDSTGVSHLFLHPFIFFSFFLLSFSLFSSFSVHFFFL